MRPAKQFLLLSVLALALMFVGGPVPESEAFQKTECWEGTWFASIESCIEGPPYSCTACIVVATPL